MIVKPIKTEKIYPGSTDIFSLLNNYITAIEENSILAITSKIVSLCENRVIPVGSVDKEELIKMESDYYLPATIGRYGYHFTITKNSLVSMAGIDESNADNNYVLWPKDAQKSANAIRQHLVALHHVKKVGAVIVDSTSTPMRRGTIGLALAHSGFAGLNNYIGTPDLFGRPFKVSQANVANGLAASAVLVMGEGTEKTPICLIEDLPFVKFYGRDPTDKELADINIPLDEDLYAPFLKSAKWRKGEN